MTQPQGTASIHSHKDAVNAAPQQRQWQGQVDTNTKEHKHSRAGPNEHQFYFPLRETRLINSPNGKREKKQFH